MAASHARAPTIWGLFLLFFTIVAPCLPNQTVAISTNVPIKELAQRPQWLRLLHYDAAHRQGTFQSEDFYLSPQGKNDPAAELRATLLALKTPVANESHPRCRFPARYTWLANQLQQPTWQTIPKACMRLRKWLVENPLRSVSLLMVSGYLGNPASMFGHAILKLDTTGDERDLFDTTINYGALVPPKEPVITYIFKGLFGGYQAGYSDRYFYTQDIVYTNTEARDIWEYKLNLNPEQARLLQLHIWEIIGKKKQYFFLTHNCAYELGRTMDVVMDPPLSQTVYAWYTPAELFDRLHDLDQSPLDSRRSPLIKRIHYHPSAERTLIHHYESLSDRLKLKAKQFLGQPDIKRINITLSDLSPADQQVLLDFLFSYQHFIFTKEQPNPSAQTLSLKHALLMKRLSLPPSPPTDNRVAYRPSPSEEQKSSIIGAGVQTREGGDLVPSMNLIAFAQEPTGRNTLDGGELTVLDLRLNLSPDIPIIDSVDYLRIFHHALSPLPMASRWSWRIQLRSARETNEKYDHQLYFGMGRSKKARRALFYGMLTPSLHALTPIIRIRPEAGMVLPLQRNFRMRLRVGMENNTDEEWRTTTLGTFQYNPSRKFSLQLEYQKEVKSSWRLALRTHW